jgi:hypothetical protein
MALAYPPPAGAQPKTPGTAERTDIPCKGLGKSSYAGAIGGENSLSYLSIMVNAKARNLSGRVIEIVDSVGSRWYFHKWNQEGESRGTHTTEEWR